jgi:FixJ family two-component response regulator
LQALLTSVGYMVLAAANGEEALRICTSYDGPIDLLLTDVVMPGVSGPELAQHVLQSRSTVKVVFMSGHAADAVSCHDVWGPGMSFLHKPFGAETLIREVCQRRNAPQK